MQNQTKSNQKKPARKQSKHGKFYFDDGACFRQAFLCKKGNEKGSKRC
jgi:hypothetical protein